ncbi:MAG: hypothetical protein JNL25_08800 [Rhodospirillaceae bacterium]|nr:hypothetical protein [Rhodospirillaceae bacterium]
MIVAPFDALELDKISILSGVVRDHFGLGAGLVQAIGRDDDGLPHGRCDDEVARLAPSLSTACAGSTLP